jgi:hypothetical protein
MRFSRVFRASDSQCRDGNCPKNNLIEDTTLRFGRRNQMSSSIIVSIHGLRRDHQFSDSNRDIQW